MIESASIYIAGLTWVVCALACFWFLRRSTFNILDPLILGAVSIFFSAALLAALCETGWIEWKKFTLFCVVLLAYLTGAGVVGFFFSLGAFRNALVKSIASLSLREIQALLLLTVAFTLLLALLGTMQGGIGDARQAFARAFRPIIVFQSGLFYFALLVLLSRKLSTLQVVGWMLTLLVLSIPFSGKSILAPLLTWFGVKMFIEHRTVSLRLASGLITLLFVGAGAMGVIAYGVSGLGATFYFLTNRLWMSGDVYIYAYERGALDPLRDSYSVSFIAYMLHPLTSLVGVRAYEKPLGSMISSEAMKMDLLTGPNPQVPILLDFFYPDMLAKSFLIAFFIGFFVIGIRPLSVALSTSRSRYVALGGLAAAVFCPSMGFLDTSQVLITLVGIVAVTLFGAAMEMLRRPASQHSQKTASSVPVMGT